MSDTTAPATTTTPQEKTESHSELLNRLSNYTLVNSVYQQYNNLKAANPYIKAGLETAEGTTQKLVSLAQPVLTPVISKIDSTLHLEEKAIKVLDKTEEIGQNITTAYQHGVTSGEQIRAQIQTNAKDLVSKGIETAQHGKDVVVKNIETAKELVSSSYQHTVETGNKLVSDYANRPINQLLDVAEGYVKSILPHEVELEPLDIHEEHTATEEHTAAVVPRDDSSNPLPRIKELGGGVSKHVKRVAMSKLQNLNFKSPSQVNATAYVVDLIQYAADYIDYDQKKENVQKFFHNVIDKQTADIKDQATKSVVSIVSSIAHATEVVRRQFIGQVPDTTQLQENLANLTKRTKEAVSKLTEPQLSEYLNFVRSTYGHALESLIALTHAYTPSLSSPLFSSILNQLQTWQTSVFSRITHSQAKPSEPTKPEKSE